MAKHGNIRDGGIVLTDDWKLVPVDGLNWELCHRHATTRGKDEGTVKWHRCGRYYSYNTISQALLYVADQLTRAKCYDEALALVQALDQWREVVDALAARVEVAR